MAPLTIHGLVFCVFTGDVFLSLSRSHFQKEGSAGLHCGTNANFLFDYILFLSFSRTFLVVLFLSNYETWAFNPFTIVYRSATFSISFHHSWCHRFYYWRLKVFLPPSVTSQVKETKCLLEIRWQETQEGWVVSVLFIIHHQLSQCSAAFVFYLNCSVLAAPNLSENLFLKRELIDILDFLDIV